MDRLRVNDSVVSALQQAIARGDASLRNVPGLLKRVITENCWQEREVSVLNQVARFNAFMEFVTADPPEGLGTDVPTLERLCGDDTRAKDLIDAAKKGGEVKGARNDLVNNVSYVPSPEGNSATYALRRLRKDCPDLHARVLAGELSPHAAAVAAGFRPRTLTIPVDPERVARTILRHFDREQISRLVYLLADATTEAG